MQQRGWRRCHGLSAAVVMQGPLLRLVSCFGTVGMTYTRYTWTSESMKRLSELVHAFRYRASMRKILLSPSQADQSHYKKLRLYRSGRASVELRRAGGMVVISK